MFILYQFLPWCGDKSIASENVPRGTFDNKKFEYQMYYTQGIISCQIPLLWSRSVKLSQNCGIASRFPFC
jgi:hypothetical protein